MQKILLLFQAARPNISDKKAALTLTPITVKLFLGKNGTAETAKTDL